MRLRSFISNLAFSVAAIPLASSAGSPIPVAANVKPYRVSPSLAEVSNLKSFQRAAAISPGEKKLLAANLFAVAPDEDEQLFYVYEENDYSNIPSFITSDSVLQMYHIFYDFTLRSVEEEKLVPAAKILTAGMLKQTLKSYQSSHDPAVRQAALCNLAYFAVAADELGMTANVPPAARHMANLDAAAIAAHGGVSTSGIFPYGIDYSQFVPRGHYTRSEALKKYFRAMMWYGLVPLSTEFGTPNDAARVSRQILLMTHDMYAAKLDTIWQTIYEPTAFYVGTADDLRPDEIKHAAAQIYGPSPSIDAFANAAKLTAFQKAFDALRDPGIAGQMTGVPGKKQFRFMGQRYIADSDIMQKLVNYPDRIFPTGLDVMAVLGSHHAANILDNYASTYNPNNWAGYLPERSELTTQFAAVSSDQWHSNLYWSWLDTLRVLNTPAPAGYPSFMLSPEWQSKTIDTSLGSWAELRHDTILYAKQGSTAECGGDYVAPPPIRGYVEPNVAFYSRLLLLTQQSQQGLRKRHLLSDQLNQKFSNVEDLLVELRTISVKELHNQLLTTDEYDAIRFFGGQLEQLTLAVIDVSGRADWSLVSSADRDMASIADVHSNREDALEEGVGHADEILVIVPIDGKLVLTRGAVFSYFEFLNPVSDRMTDEEWQAKLNDGKMPATPPWTKTYRTSKPVKINPAQAKYNNTGC